MGTLDIVRRCYSCGAVLQGEKKEEPGYIDPKFLKKSLDTILFCDKCYHEERFNQNPHSLEAGKDFLTMLRDANASDALIVYVVDLFSFEACFIKEVNDVIKGSPMLIVANKVDLMPENADKEALREYVAHRFRVARLRVTKDDVILADSAGGDTEDIAKVIQERRRGHDVYLIGAERAGKTYFLGSFLRNYKNKSGRNIVTRDYHGTKLRVLEIPLDRSSSVYDTPGTSIANTMGGKLESEMLRYLVPNKPLVQRKETLVPGESLFFGGLARIDLISSDYKGKQEVSYYASDEIRVKKCPARQDSNKEFFGLLDRNALPPTSKLVRTEKDFDVYEAKIEETGPRDLGIAGLGWIAFEGHNQTFRIYVPHGVSVYGSRSKIR